MANLNVTVQDGNNINVEVTPTPRQTIVLDRGVAGVGIESVDIVYVAPDYFLEFTYTNGTTELVQLPETAAGVVSFNTRIGAVTLTSTDVTGALGYTPPQPNGTGATGTWTISVSGNAGTVTNGVYTTDTGTVTNTMLAGSIANDKLVNSAITINGTPTSLGGSVSVGTVTSVSGTAPIASTGGATPAISISQSGAASDGYLSSTDWNTFNSKTSNTGTVTSVAATAGTGISVTGSPITTSGTLNITNTAPDQVVSLTGAGTTAVTGTYPNFTITSDDQFDGTVTSVSGTGSVNGISLSGTVTSAGNLTLGGTLSNVSLTTQVTGTLPIANGGTNATTAADARTSLGLGTSAVLNAAVALGTATLDAGGTVPLSQIPASIQGGLNYQGTWDASTNTPTLTSSVGTKGHYYAVSVAGSTNLNGITDWNIGDLAVYNGTAWEQIDNTDAVTSVNGYTGSVVLTTTDVAEGTNEYFTQSRARTSISAGTGISYDNTSGIVTNAAPDQTVSLTGTGTTSITGTYPNFTVNSADQFSGTVTSVAASAGTGISVSGSPITSSGTITITNTAPDQVVSLTGAGTAVVTGTYPNFTVTSNDQFDGTVTSVAATAGTGISITGSPITSSGTLTITNTAPDQVVSLTGAGTSVVTGTYPNFTITSNDSATGTVTSVAATVPSFLSVSGSPITTSGTLALTYSGTALPILNGGTGATTAADALTSLGAYPASNPSGYTTNTGTVTSVGGTGTVNGITLTGTVTSSGNLTLGGTLSGVNLTTQVTGTLPVANGGTGITSFGTGVATFLGTPSSANLAAAVTDETGSGALVFGTAPTLSAPIINDGYTEEVFAVTGTTPALSPANGSIQTWTLSGNSTPTAGTWNSGQSITLMIDDGTASTVTWTSLAVTWKSDSGSAPTLNTTGYTVVTLWKVDTTIYGARVGNA